MTKFQDMVTVRRLTKNSYEVECQHPDCSWICIITTKANSLTTQGNAYVKAQAHEAEHKN